MARDEGELIAQAEGGFAVVEESQGDFAREAEGDEAAVGIESEGFGVGDADEGSESAEAFGDFGGLGEEGLGVCAFGGAAGDDFVAANEGAGSDSGQVAGYFDDTLEGEVFIGVEERAEEELFFP